MYKFMETEREEKGREMRWRQKRFSYFGNKTE